MEEGVFSLDDKGTISTPRPEGLWYVSPPQLKVTSRRSAAITGDSGRVGHVWPVCGNLTPIRRSRAGRQVKAACFWAYSVVLLTATCSSNASSFPRASRGRLSSGFVRGREDSECHTSPFPKAHKLRDVGLGSSPSTPSCHQLILLLFILWLVAGSWV